MAEDTNKTSSDEELRNENEFLKMKLMLEHGAKFGKVENQEAISPQLENEFLNYIQEFEKQFANPKHISVFEKIGKPDFFQPVADISDDDIEEAWKNLSRHLNAHYIDLSVCSPNIPVRELYRFTVEELFELNIDDMDLDGMVTCFMYDDFYPDAVYDNSRLVEQDLLPDIFCKDEFLFQAFYSPTGFSFNSKFYSDFPSYLKKINHFKSSFEEIALIACSVESCAVSECKCTVLGNYEAKAKGADTQTIFSGKFEVKLEIGHLNFWNIIAINIDSLDIG